MATDQEKEELVEAIKRPDRFYRITINGYGGESAYMSISKEAYDFWSTVKEDGDGDLVHYMVSAEDGDFDFDGIDDLPKEADFLSYEDDGEVYRGSWYEAPTEFEHSYGVTYDSAYITVDEVEDDEYGGTTLEEVIGQEDLQGLVNRVYEESGEEYIEINEYGCCDEHPEAEYIAQMYSSEKGTFFEGVVHTTGAFDPRKLKIYVTEYLNGEDTVTSIEYDGEEVDNWGGDTNGKGYSADVWKNI